MKSSGCGKSSVFNTGASHKPSQTLSYLHAIRTCPPFLLRDSIYSRRRPFWTCPPSLLNTLLGPVPFRCVLRARLDLFPLGPVPFFEPCPLLNPEANRGRTRSQVCEQSRQRAVSSHSVAAVGMRSRARRGCRAQPRGFNPEPAPGDAPCKGGRSSVITAGLSGSSGCRKR